MDEDKLRTELQAEYLYLQKVIEDFDARALTIKAWSVTFSLTAIGGAFASNAREVLLVAAVSALAFWFLEAMWKSFQLGYVERSLAIEQHLRSALPVAAPFQIGTAWKTYWDQRGHAMWARTLWWPHVAFPHALVAAAGALLYVLSGHGAVEL